MKICPIQTKDRMGLKQKITNNLEMAELKKVEYAITSAT